MAKKEIKKNIQNNGNNASYEAKDIYVLEGLEPVRKRPGMYIGSTGVDGLHHLIWEVVDNSIDEAMAGHAKTVRIELFKDNKVAVADDGRGIPVDIHPQTKKSALETVMCTLHAGGKFGGESYKVSGGLHGVGVSVVNALSKWMRAEVCRNGNLYFQEYERGKPKFAVKKGNKCAASGTKVIFEADPEVFQKISFNRKTVIDHLRQQAFLTKGVKIEIIDEREENPFYYSFQFEGGLLDFIDHLNRGKETNQQKIFYVNKNQENIEVEAAFVYNEDSDVRELSFANNIYTPDGGMHLTGFRSALTRVLNDYARSSNYLKDSEENLTGDDVREGLTAIVSIRIKEPQFEGQTKARLGNPEARTAVESVIGEALKEYLEKYSSDARVIVEKCLLAQKARKAAKAAKDTVLRKGALEGMSLPGKLADCSSRDAAQSELFIVEGDSAGGCFSGNTKIALVDGRNLDFKELIKEHRSGRKNYCYTIKNGGEIGVAEIKNPRITKKLAEVIKVVLDNNEEIVCTLDHKFMLRNGGYKMAKDLNPGDSLMPLYREEKIADAVNHFNHKIKKITPLKEKIDVYDLEVPETHNFALASGVFVHNSSKQARDRRTQAILPLRGKILNVEKSRIDKMLINNEIKSLIIALGTAIADNFDINKLRYHKVVIMTDADSDGGHIRTLLLTLFYRHFLPVIEGGYLYIAQPPLYRIQLGKEVRYAYNDSQKDKIVKEMTAASKREGSSANIQRYKGLGEMNPDQLWETTMDPEKRTLKVISIEDAEEADRLFSVLMSDQVEPRKQFIQRMATTVKNLDI